MAMCPLTFVVGGSNDLANHITLSITGATDENGYKVLVAEAENTAQMISGKPLPAEIRDLISKRIVVSGLSQNFKGNWSIENGRVKPYATSSLNPGYKSSDLVSLEFEILAPNMN